MLNAPPKAHVTLIAYAAGFQLQLADKPHAIEVTEMVSATNPVLGERPAGDMCLSQLAQQKATELAKPAIKVQNVYPGRVTHPQI